MSFKFFISAILKFLLGVLLVGLFIFLPGGLNFKQGWLFMVILFVPMFSAGLVLMAKKPNLLKRRLEAKEK